MFIALLKMSRLNNAIIAIATLAAGYFLSHCIFSVQTFFADLIAFTLAISVGNIHNDLLDIETDKLNRPNRPLPSGKISIKATKLSILILSIFTLLPAFLKEVPSITHLTFYTLLLALLFVYNKYAKRIPFLKNLTVAFLCTTPLIRLMFYESASISPLIAPIIFAFLYTLSREIQKDLEDITGDKAAGILTLPILVGEKKTSKLAIFQIILALFLLPLPVLLNWYSSLFLLALIFLIPLSVWIIHSLNKKDYSKARALTKIAMILGIIFLILSEIFS